MQFAAEIIHFLKDSVSRIFDCSGKEVPIVQENWEGARMISFTVLFLVITRFRTT